MKYLTNGLAIVSLIIAYFIGQSLHSDKKNSTEKSLFQEYSISNTDVLSDIQEVKKKDSLVGYVSFGQSQGYGGVLKVAVLSNKKGKIKKVLLTEHKETESFILKIKNKDYLSQFNGLDLNSSFLLNNDIDGVSGATVSCQAVTNSVRRASYRIAREKFNKTVPHIERELDFELETYAATGILILALIASYLRIKKRLLRYIALGLSMIFLGFLYNASISVANFGKILLGYFPPLKEHLVWWILMGGTLLAIIIGGKNIFCYSICPFHAVQILLQKISGINFKMPKKFTRYLRKTPLILLWVSLILILISQNPTIAAYEPFALLFSLKGVGIQWYILPASLIGSMFVSDFFCNFFCPVGAGFGWLRKNRNQIIKKVTNKK